MTGTVVYPVGRHIASSDFCDYHETYAAGVPCVLKVVGDATDNDLIEREADALRDLWSSAASGGEIFTRYLPRLVDVTTLPDGRGANVLAAGQHSYGDYASLAEIRADWPDGLHMRHAVWMTNRMLELLSWVHKGGTVHGAVFPSNTMYVHSMDEEHQNPDHAGMLWDWCYATRVSRRQLLPAVVDRYRDWYPPGLLGENRRPPRPADDTAMLAASVLWVLGGDPVTGEVPERLSRDDGALFPDDRGRDYRPIIDLLRSMHWTASGKSGVPKWPNTNELRQAFLAAAARVFGERRYTPFTTPTAR